MDVDAALFFLIAKPWGFQQELEHGPVVEESREEKGAVSVGVHGVNVRPKIGKSWEKKKILEWGIFRFLLRLRLTNYLKAYTKVF